MRPVFAFVMIALFALGLYIMAIAFDHPGSAAYIFSGGLFVSILAFAIPMQFTKD
ncbi:hypothetical protein SAMN05216410_0613 [Sanguibacter gelidistatuariae]|uniref:Uncharacterized protein n=1 Tax=Sanguibacter gelidistatuariae TaxID=1814289 RepID=A0A1G6H096_9MICO|nr:hypothetical protein [Sanguibacter gelidistatuariae]SDB87584.1 hypothetical protein SAMN05216410_0613 [Sanguibacter gelidistatuariae]